ncbi:MAG: inositol monophosphatase, partial [Gemmatimonadetes bacterium]|nr:inositol monophosphatase [Gemmatimonadota bacterium]NIR35582.1 inositol monophosphatase [Actinomycetota bacterium]NIU73340.1 inositol monophosphatase [Gammaproteobacteria bacterium]NIQ53192.1 inositol monophosphatase [Gemmatimonadota bacterium]NIX19425.1 inositol monophosphatase [Actinomycetota bacterium]
MRDLDVALEAARAGAAVIRSSRGAREAEFKGTVNPVTAIDRAAEEAILSVIRTHRAGDGILAEEGGGASGWDRGRVWIVDPLDGTVNFVHGIPQVA